MFYLKKPALGKFEDNPPPLIEDVPNLDNIENHK